MCGDGRGKMDIKLQQYLLSFDTDTVEYFTPEQTRELLEWLAFERGERSSYTWKLATWDYIPGLGRWTNEAFYKTVELPPGEHMLTWRLTTESDGSGDNASEIQ